MDWNILQRVRLITTYREGRDVNLEHILQHELMIVPLYLATTSCSLYILPTCCVSKQQVQTPASRLTLERLVTMQHVCQHCVQYGIKTNQSRQAHGPNVSSATDQYLVKQTTINQFLSHQTGLASWYLREIKQISLYYFQTI